MPRVTAQHKEAVRRRIMDAAIACLLRNGYQDVTTRQLLTEAGLSTGTFYNYFPSKEHLYEALAEELLGEDIRRVAEQDHGDQGVGWGLLRFLSDYVMVDPTAAVAVSSFRSRAHTSGEAAETVARLNRFVVEEFAPLVQKAQADGFLRADLDAEAMVELIDIVWDGLGRRQGSDSFQTSYERVGRACLGLLLQGALAEGASVDDVDLQPQPAEPNPRYRRPDP